MTIVQLTVTAFSSAPTLLYSPNSTGAVSNPASTGGSPYDVIPITVVNMSTSAIVIGGSSVTFATGIPLAATTGGAVGGGSFNAQIFGADSLYTISTTSSAPVNVLIGRS